MWIFKKHGNIKPQENGAGFLERLATIDFNKVYTSRTRLACHCLMWILLTFIIDSNLLLGYGLTFTNSLAFVGRSLICNMTVFYLFFYYIIPRTLFKDRLILTLLSFPFSIILWVILNHYCNVIIEKYFIINIKDVQQSVKDVAGQSIGEVISLKNILAFTTPVLYSISPFFFIKILFDVVRYYSKWFKAEQKTNQLEVEKINIERDFLKAQLNPHFLFNTLNNLYGMAMRHDSKTPQTIADLSEMMRYTLYQSGEPFVPLAREIAFLKNYISLEIMRHEPGSLITCCIQDDEVNLQVIAPLLSFVFVENAFKYGLKSKNGSFLKISVSVRDNIFNFNILNDKSIPPDQEKVQEELVGGIGIQNVRKRLESVYSGKHHLKVEDRGDRFYVEMEVDLK